MPNDNEALGCPPGSVRAILALSIIPLTMAGSITLMILMFVKEQYSAALGILSGLTGIAGSVVGYYFGTKSAEKAGKEISRVRDEEVKLLDNQIQNLTRNQSLV